MPLVKFSAVSRFVIAARVIESTLRFHVTIDSFKNYRKILIEGKYVSYYSYLNAVNHLREIIYGMLQGTKYMS